MWTFDPFSSELKFDNHPMFALLMVQGATHQLGEQAADALNQTHVKPGSFQVQSHVPGPKPEKRSK